MVRIYGDCLSGNCYKLKLVTELLGTPHAWKFVTWTDGGTRTDDFVSRVNPAGKVPVLETPKGEMIPESGAALYYLARDSHLWPTRESDRAQVLRWMFFEQYSHEPNLAVSHSLKTAANPATETDTKLAELKPAGEGALQTMEQHLSTNDWFVAGAPTIADISLYPYTYKAPVAGFDLSDYPHVVAWLGRVERLLGFISMEDAIAQTTPAK
ncbi:MAG: glutathione S-transferase family protein [Alphaproteobacteria bacterium TMED89]|nr:glutathione S-transferase [Rhodospirillaceae bacterium]RPH10872.1 MAG: glutathione S-transferase family protein [Alphaproteobacteria bacterium TMED89]